MNDAPEKQTPLWIALVFGVTAAAIAATAAEFTGMALGDANDATVTAAIVAEGCISQYGPGERYLKPKPEKCAPMVEAPNSILTMPLAENK